MPPAKCAKPKPADRLRFCFLWVLLLIALLLASACGKTNSTSPATSSAADSTSVESGAADQESVANPTSSVELELVKELPEPDSDDVPTAVVEDTGVGSELSVGDGLAPTSELVAKSSAETEFSPDQPESGEDGRAIQLPENPPERILLLTSQGPLIVDLRMWIDGQPFRHRMDQMIDEVIQLGDADEDGRTTWYELTTSPHFIHGQFGNVVISTERQRQDVVRSYDINRNDRVDREEVPGFLSQNAGSSRIFALQAMESNADRDESTIFKWLDGDGDRRLSVTEIASAATRLRLLDANDDDTLAASELMSDESEPMPRQNRRRYAQKSAILLTEYTDWPALLYLLEERYAFGNPLATADFELPGKLFERLDEDSDGQIDVKEVPRIGDLPAHFSTRVAFGTNTESVARGIELSQVAEEIQPHVQQSKFGELISLNIAQTELGISIDDRYPADQTDTLMMVWTQADADKNEYLDESEFGQVAGFFNVPFTAVDANDDDQLFQDEALRFLARRGASAQSRLQASAGVQPDSLLSYLDRNDDGRLSARELRSASAHLLELNADHGEFIEMVEVPVAMSIRVSRGVAANLPRVAQIQPPAARSKVEGPTWFTQMDTNRDGELSPKEFLGNTESFGKLDANQDGFVESSEIAE